MVLAKTKYLDVLHDNKLIVPFVEDSVINNIPHILLVTFCEEQHSFRISLWCTKQSFTIRVFANTFEDRAHGS